MKVFTRGVIATEIYGNRDGSCCRESGGKGQIGEGPELISDARGKRICTEKKELRGSKEKLLVGVKL